MLKQTFIGVKKTLGLLLVASILSHPSYAGTRTIDADYVTSSDHTKTWTPPSTTQTLVGRTSTDTLTNKSIDGATNTLTGITNSAIGNAAAIAYSKLNVAASIVNADIAGGAAIAYSKLNLALSIVAGDIASGAITAAKMAASSVDLASSTVTGVLAKANQAATTAYTDAANAFTLNNSNSYAGTASTPAMKYTGAAYTAGTATTNKPILLLEDAASSTSWFTGGTEFGVNAVSTMHGNLLDLKANNASALSADYIGGLWLRNISDSSSEGLVICGSTGGTQSGGGSGNSNNSNNCHTISADNAGNLNFYSPNAAQGFYTTMRIHQTTANVGIGNGITAASMTAAMLYVMPPAAAAYNAYDIVQLIPKASQTGPYIAGRSTMNGTAVWQVDINGKGWFVGMDAGSTKINNVTDPTSAQDAATMNYVDTQNTPVSSAISALDIDWSTLKKTGGLYTKTLGANSVFTFSNRASGETIIVRLTNTASNYTVTWPTVKWCNGTTPTMTVGAKSDIYTFIYDGTDVFGCYTQNH